MRILVTGGAGYIGTQLVSRLATMPQVEEVRIYDNLSRAEYNFFLGGRISNEEKVSFINGDVLDSRGLSLALKGIDVVYHLAAKVTTPFADHDPHVFEQTNHWGTAELVYAIEESEVQKLIFTSSTSVYGSSHDLITEDSSLNPRTFYGISKMRAEEHIDRIKDKVNALIFRCANVYGYNRTMRFDAVINRFLFDANFKNRISIHGNGKQQRAFISIDLLANALRDAAFTDVPSGTYNVVDRNLSVLDIADAMKQVFTSLEFIFINQHLELREIMADRNSKLRSYLDYENPADLKSELEEYRSHFTF